MSEVSGGVWRRERHLVDGGLAVDVALPESYDVAGGRAYPVLVCFDAQWTFGTVCDAALNLGLARLMPRVVVAGVGWGDLGVREVLPRRAEAFTPTMAAFPPQVMPGAGGARSGGAPSFLRSVTNDVLPFLDDRYRLQPDDRTFVGHSFSALFGLHVLFHEPTAFRRYLLASPSVWWDDRVMLDIEERTAASRAGATASVFVSVGDGEEEPAMPMVTNTALLAERMVGRGATGIDVRHVVIPDEVHHSTIPAAISRGLRHLFATAAVADGVGTA